MPFCHKCGAKLEEGEKFCVECGTAVKELKLALSDSTEHEIEKNNISVTVSKAELSDTSNPDHSTDNIVDKNSKAKLVNKNSIIIVAAFLTVLLIGCVIFAVIRLQKMNNSVVELEKVIVNEPKLTPIPVLTTTPVPTATPTPIPTPTPTPKPVIKVSTAIKKNYKHADEKNDYKIPKISISSVNTNAANKKIKSSCSKYSYKKYSMRYSYNVSAKYELVSIVVSILNREDPEWFISVYNVSVKTGKLLSNKDVIKIYGITEKAFFDKVKKIYKNEGGFGAKTFKSDDPKPLIKTNQKHASFKYISPYIGKGDHLCFKGYVNGYDFEGDEKFDWTKGKWID